jgi:hypothetical protein
MCTARSTGHRPVRRVPWTPLALLGLLATWSLSITGCAGDTAKAGGDPVARGRYLVTAGVCSDCHTPWKTGANGPAPDLTRFLSGHPEDLRLVPVAAPQGWSVLISETNTAFAGPWGISYAANLTPHDTGLGVWTEDMFVRAMKTGKHMGNGREILPPMPWHFYGQLTDADLRAMFAYLKTIKPVDNAAPQPTPPAS